MLSSTPMAETLKSAKRQHFSARKYGESVANLCPVLASTLCSYFLLKKMLKSALGSVRENSNNPSVVLNVCFLIFCLLLCEWNTSVEVVWCVRVVDMCVYGWFRSGRNHLIICRKCLTLSSPHPPEAASLGASPQEEASTTEPWEPPVSCLHTLLKDLVHQSLWVGGPTMYQTLLQVSKGTNTKRPDTESLFAPRSLRSK